MKQSDISLPTMNGLVVLQAYVVLHVTNSEKSTSDSLCVIASTATDVVLDSKEENHSL